MKTFPTLWFLLLSILVGMGMSRSVRAEDPRVLLVTTKGDIVVKLDPELAPKHVAQFLKLVRAGAYDTTHFHAVEPGFLIQLSNVESRRLPLTPEQAAAAKPLKAEFSKSPMTAGSLVMARQPDDPDSASSSFSILLSDSPHLVGQYTLFGHVEWGMDVVQAIGAVDTDAHKQPFDPIDVDKALVVSFEDLGKMQLRGPTPIPVRLVSVPRRPVGFLLMICLVAVVHYGLMETKRLSPSLSRSLILLEVLISFFALFASWALDAAVSPWILALLFFALLGVLKLMGRFEGQR